MEKIVFQRDMPPRLNRLRDQGNKVNISDILNISNICRTRGNCKKLNVIHNYDNTIKNIINNRSVNIWNSLNNDIIKSVFVSSFKNKINKICFDKQLFFNRNL